VTAEGTRQPGPGITEVVAAVHRNEDSGPYISCALSIEPAVGVDRFTHSLRCWLPR